MKTIKTIIALLLSVLLWTTTSAQTLENVPEKWIYAVEIGGVLCGYAESHTTVIRKNNQEFIQSDDEIIAKLSVLGGGVDMKISHHILIDRETENPVSTERSVFTTAEIYASARFENNKAYFTNTKGKKMRKIMLEPDVILENTISYPHLYRDFILNSVTEKSYRVFDDMQGIIVEKKYKLVGHEKLELAGKTFNTTLVEEMNQELGTTTKLWLNNENSFPMKIEILNRVIYLSDESVKKKIQSVNLEGTLFAKVDKIISNVPDISYMKVEATINSSGEWLTPESLNFPGQKFEGTVTNNLIEGVFEIEPVKYAGENALGFPFEYKDEELQKYLNPEKLIESDHPALVAAAKQITNGSNDSWEAVVKLSKWVSENIHGAVPGGTSAINTYNTREGECGSHSRLLTAFCRAVEIPARLSVGCMYSPYLGGSFGQHAWTEVYMGEAGWVAVDATAGEFDFVDAGHIRLGENATFNPKEMKILEYHLGSGEITEQIPEEWEKYIGKYLFEEKNSTFEILYKDGSLAVDIPGSQVLALNPPDENGILFPKLTRQINFSFNEDLYGNIRKMKLQQVFLLQKKSEPESVDENVPEYIRPLLGVYLFPQPKSEFKVFYEKGVLTFNNTLANQVIQLPKRKENGLWLDDSNSKEIEFVKNEEGDVIRMIIYINLYMPKMSEL